MKVLVVDTDAVGLAFAWRCARAGHKVKWFVKPKPSNHAELGEGFDGVEKVDNWVAHAKWADLIWTTSNDDYMPRLAFFKAKGVAYFGPSVESAALEINRAKGMEFFKEHHIEVPSYETFKSLQDAEAHVRKTDERYVFKTMGDNEDKSLSYCGKSPEDMIARLQRWQRLKMNPKGPVMLQTFIPGREFAVSRFVGSEGFIGAYNENFEHKKLLSGNAGPNCGEAGTVQKYVRKSKLADDVLAPLEEALVKLGHLGDVDVNCIVDEKGKAWPLEFTCRPGWPAMNIMLAEHRGDPCEWMFDACKGTDSMEVSYDVACGVVLAQPDYPHSNATKAEVADIPIWGITAKNLKYVQPQAVKITPFEVKGEQVPTWTTAGDYLLVVTGMGKTISLACGRAYKTVEQIEIADKMYRDDIGEKLEKELPELQKHGYALEFTF